MTASPDTRIYSRYFLGPDHIGDYMHRWLARAPPGTLRLHHILRSDSDRAMHDHPFDFTSLILRGGYIEHRPGCACEVGGGNPSSCLYRGAGSVIRREAEDLHRLELLPGQTAWTAVITGPYRRKWGFVGEDGKWIYWRDYQAAQ